MTDCIRSLIIRPNCSHLKELFILSDISFHHQSYLKNLTSLLFLHIFSIEQMKEIHYY